MKQYLACTATLALASAVVAGPPDTVRKGSPETWEAMFAAGVPDGGPLGPTRGTVLYADEAVFPRVKARLQGTIWKGKYFPGDGTFTNRWVGGIRAGTVATQFEPSWVDGRPSMVAQYPPTAPVFGNVRDELRQVAPGVWIGRSYDSLTGRPKNWFVLRTR